MRYGMLIDLRRCIGCAACVVACKQENGTGSDIYWCNVYHKEVGQYPNSQLAVLPASCMHCADAPCVNCCPTGASYHDDKGRVLVDYDKCIGCRICITACPYNARHFNFTSQEKNPYWGDDFEMTPFEKIKSKKHEVGKAEKCVFCQDRVEEGKLPACVETCVTGARVFGDLDDPNSEISIAIREKQAKPLYEHLGTKPSVYYVGNF